VRRFALAAALSVALAGCTSGTSGSGQATVWVTRDRGTQVMHVAKVPAGLTALQGLDRVAKVKTRYGGRYVRGVDGMSEHGQHSWFYYVNGYLADQGSAEYRLRNGDVEWWDFRTWRDPLDDAVVVGAFPEPFRHGYGGEQRRTVVLSVDRELGKRIARLVGGSVARTAPASDNVVTIVSAGAAPRRFSAELRRPGAGSPVRFVIDARFAARLASKPRLARFRYSVP
jgi:Domain of unknown function (DUF4430)